MYMRNTSSFFGSVVIVILWHLFDLVIFDFNSVNFYVKLDKLDFLGYMHSSERLINSIYLSRWTSDKEFNEKRAATAIELRKESSARDFWQFVSDFLKLRLQSRDICWQTQ